VTRTQAIAEARRLFGPRGHASKCKDCTVGTIEDGPLGAMFFVKGRGTTYEAAFAAVKPECHARVQLRGLGDVECGREMPCERHTPAAPVRT
jgi:hypothetical protein